MRRACLDFETEVSLLAESSAHSVDCTFSLSFFLRRPYDFHVSVARVALFSQAVSGGIDFVPRKKTSCFSFLFLCSV